MWKNKFRFVPSPKKVQKGYQKQFKWKQLTIRFLHWNKENKNCFENI